MKDLFITVSTPGRICFFGEHQDYLGLPTIAAAFNRRLYVTARRISEQQIVLNLPDINEQDHFDIRNLPLSYSKNRDYFRSAFNVLFQHGFRFSCGIEATIQSEIPINAGAASSSALTVSWINTLVNLSDNNRPVSPTLLASWAYQTEVLEFSEPGGPGDHIAVALGGVNYIESRPTSRVEKLTPPLGNFVLADSGEPKDTIKIVRRIKTNTERIVQSLHALDPNFSLYTTPTEELVDYRRFLNNDDFILIEGTLSSRDLLLNARKLLTKNSCEFDHQLFGRLLSEHNNNLRSAQRILTPKIDRMLEAALKAGALGGKINGSGGGGCMFVYTPKFSEEVVEAIQKSGGQAYVVNVDVGSMVKV